MDPMVGAVSRDREGMSLVNILLDFVHDENIESGNRTTKSMYRYWLSAKLTPIR